MSAPNLPRYTVGSVTGYAIKQESRSQHSKPSTNWCVYDSWWNYALVGEFKRGGWQHATGFWRSAEIRARELADQLNREHLKLAGRVEAIERPMDARPASSTEAA